MQGAETVLFIYDGWNVIQEWSSATVDKAYLVWGDDLSGSKQGAGGVGGLLMRQVTGGQTHYYHYDANGNPARLTGATSGAGTGTYRYDAFGNVRTAEGLLVNEVGENPWQFSTKYHDPETGFSYYGYRYYDPVTGRWPSRDPIGEWGGFNVYAFSSNSAISKYDRLGLDVPAPKIVENGGKLDAKAEARGRDMKISGKTDVKWGIPVHKVTGEGKCDLVVKQEDGGSAETKLAEGADENGEKDFKGLTLKQHEAKRREIFKKNFEAYRSAVNPLEKTYDTPSEANEARRKAYDLSDFYEKKNKLEQNKFSIEANMGPQDKRGPEAAAAAARLEAENTQLSTEMEALKNNKK